MMYSNQTRQDIKQTFCKALERAKEAIFISVYGISDRQILKIVNKKVEDKISLRIEYDPSASGNLKKKFSSCADVRPIKSKGLMHRKILVIDHALVFLGTANLTTSSLRHHANLVLGFYNPQLASYLERPEEPCFSFVAKGQTGEIFMLPDPQNMGLKQLLSAIEKAKTTIYVAMFTLTHPELFNALSSAQKRGVDVRVAIDYYTSRGASKKAMTAMQKDGVKIILSQGKQLLHHKWALIDEDMLIMGSANWTKAAFSKNQDFLFFLSPLCKKQRTFFRTLWNVIEAESIDMKAAA